MENLTEAGRTQRKFTMIKWGVTLLAVAVVAPIAWMAVTGIVGLAIAGAIGLIGINAAPVVALKLSNMKDRAIDAEHVSNITKVSNAAAVNPIETLIQQSLEKRQASDQFKGAITMFRTEVKNFADQIAGFAKEYPDDVERFNNQLTAMNKLLTFREDRYKQLQRELDNFDSAIKRAQAMWKMSQAAQKMNKLAGVEMADPFEKIKADSAINSVMTSMNKAFAEMETALLDNKEVQQANLAVGNDPSPVLQGVGSVVQQQKVSV
jgi:hypothetical protein